jgi:CheY-like chemotaxis protein
MATILLIDDDESDRMALQVVLEAAGHRVLSAAGEREGLRLMHDHVVDLVLVDLVMPDMDGLGCGSAHTPFHVSRISC